MQSKRIFRYVVIGIILLAGVYWTLASANGEGRSEEYPAEAYLTDAAWLAKHRNDQGVVVVDVREDKYFDGRLIPGAIRLPWGNFRYDDTARGIGGKFVGIERSQKILGENGLAPTDTLVLYDSVERDGGATASYVFWVLDLLGHENKKILDGGIDAWTAAGQDLATEPKKLDPLLYQARSDTVRFRRLTGGDFINSRLGDPHYQILDVRSREEYLGQAPNIGLDGSVLKLGHIPTAVNVDYRLNWTDSESKRMKTYRALQELYRGLDTSRSVIVYCHSARRSSFSYFVLRLMGFKNVLLYDGSWNEWGNHRFYFPVETRENLLAEGLPMVQAAAPKTAGPESPGRRSLKKPEDGYVSCGG